MPIDVQAVPVQQTADEFHRSAFCIAKITGSVLSEHPRHVRESGLGTAEAAKTTISTRCAPEWMPCLEHTNIQPGLGHMQCGGQAREAGTDDDHIGGFIGVKDGPISGFRRFGPPTFMDRPIAVGRIFPDALEICHVSYSSHRSLSGI